MLLMGEVPVPLLLLLLWLRMLHSVGGGATFALPKLGLHALGAALLWTCLWAELLSVCVILLQGGGSHCPPHA